MSKESINALVDGGNASLGPPLGPALGPLGVNTGQVVTEINKKTKSFEGMKIPIEVIVDTETKKFEIKVGSPPTSALIKKELGLEKGTGNGTPVGDLSFERLIKIASMKKESLLSPNFKNALKEVVGTCQSLGVTIEGLSPKEVTKKIDAGEFDDKILKRDTILEKLEKEVPPPSPKVEEQKKPEPKKKAEKPEQAEQKPEEKPEERSEEQKPEQAEKAEKPEQRRKS